MVDLYIWIVLWFVATIAFCVLAVCAGRKVTEWIDKPEEYYEAYEVEHVCGEIRDCRDLTECSTCDEAEAIQSKAYDLQDEIWDEWSFARESFGPFHSSHEGFAVLHEEFDELKAEVWKNGTKHPERDAQMRKEAIQVAAMALRFLTDCCPNKETTH